MDSETCVLCGSPLPPRRRKYCSTRCIDSRYRYDPVYREWWRRYVREKQQIETYGRVLYGPEDIIHYSKDRFKHARALGYRSGLEVAVADQIRAAGLEVQYELFPIKYLIPERYARYTLDFIIPNGIIVETKGQFTTEDRKKHRLLKEQYPDLDIRIVFSNPNAKIGKKSQTTYAMWCEKVGIPYAAKRIPEAWLKEPPCEARLAALHRIVGWTPPT